MNQYFVYNEIIKSYDLKKANAKNYEIITENRKFLNNSKLKLFKKNVVISAHFNMFMLLQHLMGKNSSLNI
jgi:hypothetical protein